jgi:LacI family transcriptional regulator
MVSAEASRHNVGVVSAAEEGLHFGSFRTKPGSAAVKNRRKPMNEKLRIGLAWNLCPYSEDALKGALKYSHERGPFQFFSTFSNEFDSSRLSREHDLDGLLVYRTYDHELTEVDFPADIPIVSCSFIENDVTPHKVLTDNIRVGRWCAEALLGRGLHHLAYCPFVWFHRPRITLASAHWDRQRLAGFDVAARAAGIEPIVYDPPLNDAGCFEHEWAGPLARWVGSLPKPIGIMGANDYRARHLLLAAKVAGVRVPDEMAVIGVDNVTWTQVTDPPISSVVLDGFRVGYVAMEMLHRLIEGRPVAQQIVHVPPRTLIQRTSSDMLAIDDPDVIQAMQYIEDHALRGISVKQVVNAVAVARRGLERRFQHALGRSILDKIRSVQIERAKALLSDGDTPVHCVAEACGFHSAVALSTIFHRITGMTPTAYRATENENPLSETARIM